MSEIASPPSPIEDPPYDTRFAQDEYLMTAVEYRRSKHKTPRVGRAALGQPPVPASRKVQPGKRAADNPLTANGRFSV